MCYYVNLTIVTSKLASKDTIEKDRNNRNEDTGDTRMYSLSSFLVTGSTSMFERCSTIKDTNTTKAHLILWGTSQKGEFTLH
jgi:hypothetical protein